MHTIVHNMGYSENTEVKIVEPNKGKHIAVAGDINTIIASKDDTGGTYSFIEAKVFPGGGPAPHIQTREHEGFYVIDGQLTFKIDKKRLKPNQEHLLMSHQMFCIVSKMKLTKLQN